ncbi:hypothetical protein FLP41_15265 [Paracoccus marcusii]|uniref:hypothetical protein n=1 Tax=Paracoccus marcusii TaxID=59779 RepID=UPI002ECFD011|nr:hypothetical protein FLP41_15265 [Paracoccus marcusii]
MITMLLVLILLCMIIPWRIVGFLMILGVIHHCTTAEAEAGPTGHPRFSRTENEKAPLSRAFPSSPRASRRLCRRVPDLDEHVPELRLGQLFPNEGGLERVESHEGRHALLEPVGVLRMILVDPDHRAPDNEPAHLQRDIFDRLLHRPRSRLDETASRVTFEPVLVCALEDEVLALGCDDRSAPACRDGQR